MLDIPSVQEWIQIFKTNRNHDKGTNAERREVEEMNQISWLYIYVHIYIYTHTFKCHKKFHM
jgi:hypothetical protein